MGRRFIGLLLLLLLAFEERVRYTEARLCYSKGGLCSPNPKLQHNCTHTCKLKGFQGGLCRRFQPLSPFSVSVLKNVKPVLVVLIDHHHKLPFPLAEHHQGQVPTMDHCLVLLAEIIYQGEVQALYSLQEMSLLATKILVAKSQKFSRRNSLATKIFCR
ncbi:unnamed protein product [Camellia sinensis]